MSAKYKQKEAWNKFSMVYVLNFQTLYSFRLLIICWVFWLEFTNACQSDKQGRSLLDCFFMQSDLGLHCLSRPFWQAISVRNIRTFPVNQLETVDISDNNS